MSWSLASVILPGGLTEPLTYAVPAELQERLGLGHAVSVPLRQRQVTGYVLGPGDPAAAAGFRIRPIERLLDPRPAFDEGQLRFLKWLAGYYRSPLGQVIATALPAPLKQRSRSVWFPTEEGIEAIAAQSLQGAASEVLREVMARPGLTGRGIAARLKDFQEREKTTRSLHYLKKRKLLRQVQEGPQTVQAKRKILTLTLSETEFLQRHPRAGHRQRELVARLQAKGGRWSLEELSAELGPYARNAARTLVKRGVLELHEEERRDAVTLGELLDERPPPPLTEAQASAVEQVLGPPRVWLLHGVTGAGKTEVYLRVSAAILEQGKQVIVLVPEIGLTPLLTGRFRSRFGDAIAVLHSGLTTAQRLREWRRIRAGEAQLVVGARSALFAPCSELGLIVVDEEHDGSYKQEEGVRYSARDMAVLRGKQLSCPVILGSATPSLETYQNALEDRYGLLQLLKRPTPSARPEVEVVDMRQVPRSGGRLPLLAPQVIEALQDGFDQGGQAVVLFNRRGYATGVQCEDCGGAYRCPSCGIGLVLHQKQRTLMCHYCGFHRPHSGQCPSCQSARLSLTGRGTEQVEELLGQIFPQIPIARMDADTTQVRGAHHRILETFRSGETRLLLGTQLVAKGHDFPAVNVAVVVSADHMLMMPDFRAAERTYALITQLAGRAGRGSLKGRVLVQTSHPEHEVFTHMHDYRSFHERECERRKLFGFPPFHRLVMLRLESSQLRQVQSAATQLARRLREELQGRDPCPAQVLGPSPAAMSRLMGRWRYQILLRGSRSKAFRDWLSKAPLTLPSNQRGVKLVVDVDPRSVL